MNTIDLIKSIYGSGGALTEMQMCTRGITVYLLALLMMRISGRRTFGRRSPFDSTIMILLGAILSRAVVGASPFIATILTSLMLVLLHRLIAWASSKSITLSRLLSGRSIKLYANGELIKDNLNRGLINKDDLEADLRLKANTCSLNSIDTITLENTGEVSITRKMKS